MLPKSRRFVFHFSSGNDGIICVTVLLMGSRSESTHNQQKPYLLHIREKYRKQVSQWLSVSQTNRHSFHVNFPAARMKGELRINVSETKIKKLNRVTRYKFHMLLVARIYFVAMNNEQNEIYHVLAKEYKERSFSSIEKKIHVRSKVKKCNCSAKEAA